MPGETEATQWDPHKTQKQNFAAMGLESDPRPRGGRNKKGTKGSIMETSEKPEFQLDGSDEATFQSDAYDELRAMSSKMRTTGKALPKRLTSNQRIIVEKLMKAHGTDVEAMARDIKLNRMQHTEGVLRGLVKSYLAYPCLEGGGNRGFHAPKKSLGR